MADDLNFQKMSTAQSAAMGTAVTLASAATIAPTTWLTFVTGTTQVATITPPVNGIHSLVLVFTNASPGATLTSGNIQLATTVVQNKALMMTYDPGTAKYYPSY